MKKLHEFLYQYGLHDCQLNNVAFEKQTILFCFDSGVYELNSTGKETKKTKPCKMIIEVDSRYSNELSDHIEIICLSRKKIKEIDCDSFVHLFQKYQLVVDMIYYSYFCNTIMLIGYMNNKKYELTISEIDKIDFSFS